MQQMIDKIKNLLFPTHTKVDTILLYNLYEQGSVGYLASFACSLLILISHLHSYDKFDIKIWFLALCIIILFRSLLTFFFYRSSKPESKFNLWLNLYIIGAFLNGLGWGLLGTTLFSYENSLQHTLSLVILCGITSGAVPLLSHFCITALAFLLPALLPLILEQFLQQNNLNILFGFAVTVYLIYLIVLSIKTHKIMALSIGLRYENDSLLASLSNAKSELEYINHQLELTATHDPLTRIANRELFIKTLNNAIQFSTLTSKPLFLFYLDIDMFKQVNDQHGHTYGDLLLIAVTRRIKHILRKDDTFSRLGGDEFTIILVDTNEKQIKHIARRICESIARPFNINDKIIQVYTSIGISQYPTDGTNADDLIYLADKAMYYTKRNSGNGYHFYNDIKHQL